MCTCECEVSVFGRAGPACGHQKAILINESGSRTHFCCTHQ